MKIDLVYVNYNNERKGLKLILIILKLLRIYSRHIIVENKKLLDKDDPHAINGTNNLQDFSGYYEGIKQIEKINNNNQYVMLVNDTFSKHRVFGLVSYLSLIYQLLKIKVRNKVENELYCELTGNGIGEILYGVKITHTFSSYLFICNRKILQQFFKKYFELVRKDLIFKDEVLSKGNNLSENYLNNLNGYLGYREESDLGIWYQKENKNNEVKLDKAKCLVLERLLPTYINKNQGKINNLYASKIIKIFRSIEYKIVWVYKWIFF
jgi:hypothetical protein